MPAALIRKPSKQGAAMDVGDRQVLATDAKSRDASEIAARDEFNRRHPPITGLVVPSDLRTMELPERPWRNNRGRWFHLAGSTCLDAHIAELPPGGASVRHRHTTEAYLYIVRGHGFSIVNYDGEPEERIDWQEGTLFSPPVWAWHQHFNLSEHEPARYLAIQNTRLMRHLRIHNLERHPTQLKIGDGLDYRVEPVPAPSAASGDEPR
jgi:mannose-6-phosphate isomerase-like protein (cupin superfamily)